MTTRSTYPQTLVTTLWPTYSRYGLGRGVLLALAGSLLLTLSAKVQVPLWPVPMTMQTFLVLLIGAAFGPRLGPATVALYLAAGAIGLPVFAGTPERGIGIAYMLGPTGGYLAGFVVGAALLGWLAERGFDRTVWRTLAAMTAGQAVIYLCGAAWLSAYVGLSKAVTAGVLPFLPGAVLKIGLAAAVLPMIWQVVQRKEK